MRVRLDGQRGQDRVGEARQFRLDGDAVVEQAVHAVTGPRKDLAGDYFTADTYFGARGGDGADCLFHHGIPVKAELAGLADTILPALSVKADAHGLFASVVLDMADEYHAAIAALAAKGALGWSSGSAPHMVKRAPDGYLSRWPIIEGSLTPQPCEPRTVMKSLFSPAPAVAPAPDPVAEALADFNAGPAAYSGALAAFTA